MTLPLAVAVLVAGGVYLVLQRGLVRVALGFVLLGHAVNLVLLAAGGSGRREPPLGSPPDPAAAADPLPQAFALTAIVITFGVSIYLLGLAAAGGDEVPGDGLPADGSSRPDPGSPAPDAPGRGRP